MDIWRGELGIGIEADVMHIGPMREKMKVLAVVAALAFTPPLAAKTITVAAGADAQERLQEALIAAEPGDVVALGAGRFVLTDGLSLDVDKVTVKGEGIGNSILDFSGQLGSGEGLLVTSDDVVLRDFAVENTKGDGIKSKGADRIVYHKLRVEWTGGPKATNGAYGIYPVESSDVLVDGVLVRGASDAGVYVGQSKNIIVRNSLAIENVAGIEIENSFDADVHDNIAWKNTGGVLVFDLPNLPQLGGRNIRVFSNIIIDNMTPNFAPKGNIVASVPTGTGVMVMANSNVQIFDNVLGDNGTSNIMVVGYRQKTDDPKYQPLSKDISMWENQHLKAGWAPDFPGGAQIAAAMDGSLPPIFWDGSGGPEYAPFVGDNAPAISLGLVDPTADPTTAKLAQIEPGQKKPAMLPAIKLPDSMESVIN
jgi:parallel beta-helix repeat protein